MYRDYDQYSGGNSFNEEDENRDDAMEDAFVTWLELMMLEGEPVTISVMLAQVPILNGIASMRQLRRFIRKVVGGNFESLEPMHIILWTPDEVVSQFMMKREDYLALSEARKDTIYGKWKATIADMSQLARERHMVDAGCN